MIYVDMLNFAALYNPVTANPSTAEPTTAPARLKIKKVRRTSSAKASRERRSFSFWRFGGRRSVLEGIGESGYDVS
jgi:hypothetical protein